MLSILTASGGGIFKKIMTGNIRQPSNHATMVYTPKRNRLSDELFEKLVILKANCKKW